MKFRKGLRALQLFSSMFKALSSNPRHQGSKALCLFGTDHILDPEVTFIKRVALVFRVTTVSMQIQGGQSSVAQGILPAIRQGYWCTVQGRPEPTGISINVNSVAI